MVQRQQSLDRRRARQEQRVLQLSSRQQRKPLIRKLTIVDMKKGRFQDHEDDLWNDSDESDGENGPNAKLPPVLLMVGPVGSWKTSLVHAVVLEDSGGCRVLEVSTAERRGNAAFRKIVEETTQSHSSLELLIQHDPKTAELGHEIDQSSRDSGNDMSDDNLLDSDCESVAGNGTSSKKGSALTVILVDEVDLLYDNDSGFWNALSDLSKRSKSPMILTANSIPAGIESCCVRGGSGYRLLEVPRPAVDECTEWLRNVANKEGFGWRSADPLEQNRALDRIVKACRCDLRRLAHELQLFAHSNAGLLSPTSSTLSFVHDHPSIPSEGTSGDLCSALEISFVEPPSVRAESYSYLVVQGSGFLSLASPVTDHPSHDISESTCRGHPVVVIVGDQPCPLARIVSDSTILVVKAPCPTAARSVPLHSSICIMPPRRPWSAELNEITVSSVQPLGLLSSTQGSIQRFEKLPSGARGVARGRPCLLEYQSSNRSVIRCVEGTETVEEHELHPEGHDHDRTIPVRPPLIPPDTSPIDWDLVNIMFQRGWEEWAEAGERTVEWNEFKPKIPALSSADVDSVDVLATTFAWASDAVWIKDLGFIGTPWLGGTCKGFGFDLTGCPPPQSSHEKSKRYDKCRDSEYRARTILLTHCKTPPFPSSTSLAVQAQIGSFRAVGRTSATSTAVRTRS
jgi:hypothetical protein